MPRIKHNLYSSRIYKIWQGMKTRCLNKNDPNYARWGARGVTLHPAWNKFEEFYLWATSNGYSDDLTIDRIDNAKSYCPENCRWTTFLVQARNKTTNKLNESMALEIRQRLSNGEKAKDLSIEFNCSPQNICDIRKNRIWK